MDCCEQTPQEAAQETTDPVCGMRVDQTRAAAVAEHAGESFYFCGTGCAAKFKADPERYLHPKPARENAGSAGEQLEYTCPMHPQVQQMGPGSCPKCGMALEPMDATAEVANPELADMTRRLWVAGGLTLPLLVVMISQLVPGPRIPPSRLVGWGELGLATPVVLWAGWPFFERGWASVKNRSLNMFTLIAIGAGSAYLYSVVAVVAPRVFPAAFRDGSGEVGLYFEAAAVITVLVLLGQVLELRARSQTGAAIRALLGLAPKTARRVGADGRETDVPLGEVRVGDLVRVRPGEKVPVDGEVTEGRSLVDESMVSGEAVPVEKVAGAKAIGGTMNGTGSFVMRAERVGGDTLLAQIVKMVSAAQRTRAPIQRMADKVASYFVPVVIGAAAVTFIVWAVWGPQPRFAHALVNAVSVLIIACPCALGLATPMSIMVGTGRGASEGILIRDAEALEVFEKVTTLVVDKTGTLTEGRPRLMAVVAAKDFSEDEILRAVASLEQASEHPLAGAIVEGAAARGIGLAAVERFESTTGKGVTGVVEGKRIGIGNDALMREFGAGAGLMIKQAEEMRAEGQTVMLISSNERFAGMVAVADPLKDSAAETVRELKAAGLKIIMLTGDNHTTAAAVAGMLGIDFEADVLPQEKAEIVKRLQARGGQGTRTIVAMAGDGVNDAPALAQAQLGIAMGTGTDVAMETSGITLVKGDLRAILRGRRLSQRTMRNIRQNLFFAFVYNAVGVPLAAGVLYPLTGLLLSPMIAAAAMSFSSVSVIANALRLRRVRI